MKQVTKEHDMDLLKQLIGEQALQMINSYIDIDIKLTPSIEFNNNLDIFTKEERELYCGISTSFERTGGEYAFININLNNKELGYISWGSGYGLDTDILIFIQSLINKNIVKIIEKNIKSVYEVAEV